MKLFKTIYWCKTVYLAQHLCVCERLRTKCLCLINVHSFTTITVLKVTDSPFLQFCLNDKKAQKYLLGGFECLVKLYQTQLLPRVAVILKDLYDADLLEEDVILAWAEKVCICQFYIQLRLMEHFIISNSLNCES